MQAIEADADVISFPANQPLPAAQGEKGGNYDSVRFNAMKHGILSRYTVLSHEDADEYRALLVALAEEHQPAGATEAHLARLRGFDPR